MAMLAERFDKRGHMIKYPAYIQPKLDGVRALYNYTTNTFKSRSGLPIGQGSHNILKELREATWPDGHLHLDGELYAHGLSFQNVMKLVNSNDPKLTFSVYDYAGTADPYSTRLEKIKRFFLANVGLKHIKYVETLVANSPADVKKLHDRFVSEGYEGAIVRSGDGVYTPSRSNHLQKVKEFQDAEFRVEGHKKDVSGKVLWVCSSGGGGRTFTVKPNSSDVMSNEVNHGSRSAASLVGRLYTVKYQELTDDGIPRFPIGLGFKDTKDIQPRGASAMDGVIDLTGEEEVIELDEEGEVVRPSKKIRISSPKRAGGAGGSPRRGSPRRGSPRRSRSPQRTSPGRAASPRRAGGAGGSPKKSPPRAATKARSKTVGKDRGCEQQFTAKYTSRPSPPYPANNCCGRHIKGNDGNMYTSVKNSAGICAWKMGEF